MEHYEYIPSAVDNTLYETLVEVIPFQKEEVVVFGKRHILDRMAVRYGTELSQSYKGIGVERKPLQNWPDVLLELRDVADEIAHEYVSDHSGFNFCLCNYYPSGKASIGYHSDDENDYVENSCILSMSFGATRDFLVKPNDGSSTIKVPLHGGDVFIMKSGFQQLYKHSVPKRAKADGRINLTFRCFK